MRFILECIDCLTHNAQTLSVGEVFPTILKYGEVNSDLIIEFNCEAGHNHLAYFNLEHFDMLYSAAVDSFFKGCYSESVMGFSVALERIYELFTKVACIDKSKNISDIEMYWKGLKHQSERQYGAFCTMYYYETGKVWKINEKMVAFRNNVIHKGLIASKEETETYATYVTELLSHLIVVLKTKYPDSLKSFSDYKKAQIVEKGKQLADDRSLPFVENNPQSMLKWFWKDPVLVTFEEVKKWYSFFDYFGLKRKEGHLNRLERKTIHK